MPSLNPVSRRDLMARLRDLGFHGPYPGGDHQFMVRGQRRVYIPNPHRGIISVGLLDKVLDEAGVSRDEWARTRT